MKFTSHKRRQPPAVIIVSLIDVLIVVLIFLMVTTTFKKDAAVKLALPVSKQSKEAGVSKNSLVVTIPKSGPLHLGTQPVTWEKLQEQLLESAKANPDLMLSIKADTDAPFGQIIKVMDAAKAANIKAVSAFTKTTGN
jgi:biopolymer transport protein ExbD